MGKIARALVAVTALAALAGSAGCGSTVQTTAQGPGSNALAAASGPASGLGGVSSTPAAGDGSTTSGTSGGGGAAGASVSGGGGTAGGAGSPGGASTGDPAGGAGSVSGGAAPTSIGPGVTATAITIGVSYAANAGAANSAIGGKGITTGNEPADAQIVIADINSHGGVLGRKLVPLFYQRDAQSTAPVANQAQSECSFYTQDHHVFAVLVGNGPIDWAEKPCLNAAGVPTITSHIASLDDADTHLSDDVDVAGMDEVRLAQAQLAAITAEQWTSPWNASAGTAGAAPAKVGVVSYDLPAVNQAVNQVLLPGLAHLGHPVASSDVFRIAIPQSSADDGAAEAALQDAVLHLRSDNVDHVVLVDNGGALTLLFANDAYSQHYLPRYAGTSSNGFEALLSGGDIQAAVLTGMVGAGWEPVIDLPLSDTGPYVTPTRSACLGLMRAGNQSFTDGDSESVALGYCDKLSFLRRVLDGAGQPTLAAYLGAVNSLGSFASARGLGSRFGAGSHDGGVVYADMVYTPSCTCIAYKGAEQTLGSA